MSPAELEGWLIDPHRRVLVMGVLNVTPDSFSDGGRFTEADAIKQHVEAMIAGGADWIDVGPESTRPGSQSVDDAEQIRRAIPAVEIAARAGVVVSIDTTRAAVARAALDARASVVNDISAGRDDPAIFALAAERKVPVALMHMQGTPLTMQLDPHYDDVVAEVESFLKSRIDAAVAAGIERHRILIDPGIGFGKTLEHNLRLLHELPRFASLNQPLLIGTSRKGFIGTITGEPKSERRQFGTAATVAWSVAAGAAVVRVHDVREMTQVVRMADAIRRG